jgi:hypothetical protein
MQSSAGAAHGAEGARIRWALQVARNLLAGVSLVLCVDRDEAAVRVARRDAPRGGDRRRPSRLKTTRRFGISPDKPLLKSRKMGNCPGIVGAVGWRFSAAQSERPQSFH